MSPALWSAVFATLAGILFYVAALRPALPGRRRIAIATVGVVLDWLPLGLSLMAMPGEPPAILLRAHLGFGVLGYLGLAGLATRWWDGREGGRPLTIVFLGGWTVGYLAGVAMAVATT